MAIHHDFLKPELTSLKSSRLFNQQSKNQRSLIYYHVKQGKVAKFTLEDETGEQLKQVDTDWLSKELLINFIYID